MAPDDVIRLTVLTPPPGKWRIDVGQAVRLLRTALDECRRIKDLSGLRLDDDDATATRLRALGATINTSSKGKPDLTATGWMMLTGDGQPPAVRSLAARVLDEWFPPRGVRNALKAMVERAQENGGDPVLDLETGAGLTRTGRLSLSKPAPLHSLPRKPANHRSLVSPATPGHVVVAADWSSLEMRVAASLSGDEGMLAAFADGRDLLGEMAAMARCDRDTAKRLWYGLAYGSGAPTTAANLGVSLQEAKDLRQRIEAAQPGLTEWRRRLTKATPDKGFVTTPTGRSIQVDLSFQAVVYMIQATAADILLEAVTSAWQWGWAPALTWHDALYLTAPASQIGEATEVLRAAMVTPPDWLPGLAELPVSVEWGRTLACERGPVAAVRAAA